MRTALPTLALVFASATCRAPAGAQSPNIEQRLQQIRMLFQERRYAEAYDEARSAATTAPGDRNAQFWLGATARRNGRMDEALSAYLRAVELKPDYAEALNNLGDIHETRQEWQNAIEYYKKAIGANSHLAAPHAGLGDVYRKNGAWSNAAEHYEAAVKLDPDDALSSGYLVACREAVKQLSDQGIVDADTLRSLSGPMAVMTTRGFAGRRPDEPPEPRRFAIGFTRNEYAVASLTTRAKAQLDQVASVLVAPEWKGKKLIFEGYTCSCGAAAANEALGRKRAEAILQYLVEKGGVRANDVRIVSFGARKPIAQSPSVDLSSAACQRDSAHTQNRRVVIQEAPEGAGSEAVLPVMKVSFWQRPSKNADFRPLANGALLRSGNEVKITMQARKPVHAYLLHHGSGGEWTVLFPNPRFSRDAKVNNPLEADRLYSIPGTDTGLPLDSTPGLEETFVYVNSEPDPDLQQAVDKLLRGEVVQLVAPPAPAESRPASKGSVPIPTTGLQPPRVGEVAAGERPGAQPTEGVRPIRTRGFQNIDFRRDVVYLPERSLARVRFRHER